MMVALPDVRTAVEFVQQALPKSSSGAVLRVFGCISYAHIPVRSCLRFVGFQRGIVYLMRREGKL